MNIGSVRHARDTLLRAISAARGRLSTWWERESARRPELAASLKTAHEWLRETFNIRARLAIWCAILMAAILLLLSFVTYTIAESQLEGSVQVAIKHRAEAIAKALMHEQSPSREVLPTPVPTLPSGSTPSIGTATPPSVSTPDPASQAKIQQQLMTVPDVLGQLDLGFEVLDSQGQLKYVAPTLVGGGLPQNPEVVSAVLHGGAPTWYTAVTPATAITPSSQLAIYAQPLVLQAPPSVGGRGQIVGVVLVAKSLDDMVRALLALRQVLLLGDIVAIALASFGGWFIAERGLRPVATVTHTAHAIAVNADAAGLQTRVPYSGPRDEVGELVTTFNDMLAALERVTNAQRRFVQDASHELRAPLTSIKGNLEFLRRASDLPAEQRAALTDAESEATRLGALINDLLLLARLDAAGSGYGLGATWLDEQLRGRREPVALDEVLMTVFRQGRAQLQARHKNLHLSVRDLQPTTVLADPGQMRQLIFILVDNAIKYTPDGGRVRLALARTADDWATLTVEDSGMGIAETDIAHIFERFYRADQARARDEQGSGLGLAIAKWLVQAHGGTIDVTSAPGNGTTFTVRLKAEAQTKQAATPRVDPRRGKTDAANLKGVRLLAGSMLTRIAVTTVSKSRRAALRSARAVGMVRRSAASRDSVSASAKHRSIKAPSARPGRARRRVQD